MGFVTSERRAPGGNNRSQDGLGICQLLSLYRLKNSIDGFILELAFKNVTGEVPAWRKCNSLVISLSTLSLGYVLGDLKLKEVA